MDRSRTKEEEAAEDSYPLWLLQEEYKEALEYVAYLREQLKALGALTD